MHSGEDSAPTLADAVARPQSVTPRMSDQEVPAIIRQGGRCKPQIRVEQIDGTPVLVKDFAVCGRWFRRLIGRWLVNREEGVLRAAEGCPGVPRLIARLGPYALAVEHVGRSIAELGPARLPPTFWQDFARTVDELHGRGIAHGDLKRLGNIMVHDNGSVYLVDFNSGVVRSRSPVHRWLYGYLAADDRRAIVKAKRSLQPELLTEEEVRFLRDRPLIERVFRCARVPVLLLARAVGGRKARDNGGVGLRAPKIGGGR